MTLSLHQKCQPQQTWRTRIDNCLTLLPFDHSILLTVVFVHTQPNNDKHQVKPILRTPSQFSVLWAKFKQFGSRMPQVLKRKKPVENPDCTCTCLSN